MYFEGWSFSEFPAPSKPVSLPGGEGVAIVMGHGSGWEATLLKTKMDVSNQVLNTA